MLTLLSPTTVAPPFSRYSQAVQVTGNARWLYMSGQVGVFPDGTLAGADLAAQGRQAWKNILALLEAANMSPRDLVKVTAFMVGPLSAEDLATYRAVRDELLEGAEPASSAVVVAGLARADLRIEIEAVAARVDG
jgi:enamine deaminase RidA (YjgF/YER057c/UK114 family)